MIQRFETGAKTKKRLVMASPFFHIKIWILDKLSHHFLGTSIRRTSLIGSLRQTQSIEKADLSHLNESELESDLKLANQTVSSSLNYSPDGPSNAFIFKRYKNGTLIVDGNFHSVEIKDLHTNWTEMKQKFRFTLKFASLYTLYGTIHVKYIFFDSKLYFCVQLIVVRFNSFDYN